MKTETKDLTAPLIDETDSTYYLLQSEAVEGGLVSLWGQLETAITLSEFCPRSPKDLHQRRDGRARVLATSAFDGSYVSVTVRKQQWSDDQKTQLAKALDSAKKRLEESDKLRKDRDGAQSEWDRQLDTGRFLVNADTLVDCLYRHLLSPQACGSGPLRITPKNGLLIFSGQTGCGKTEILKRFLIRYLRAVDAARKPPHLLTFEDPIESPLWSVKQVMDWKNQMEPLPIDYTPRAKGKDAKTLGEVLSAALRQTPAAVYVGETRALSEWKELLDFAATGHLVVTTSHAGTLTECMDSLLRACDASSPSGRAEVASRVLGIVHLKTHLVENGRGSKPVKAQIPALWRRTDLGQKLLMSEGLSSIVPGFFPSEPRQDSYSFGRTHFARLILAQAGSGEGLDNGKKADLLTVCRGWDLQGA